MARGLDRYLHNRLSGLISDAVSGNTWTPNTDVYETADHIVVKVELAGVEREDLDVVLTERLLVVRGQRRDYCRQHPQQCRFRQMEIDYGPFECRVIIPRSVDGQRTRARFHNGFLQIELPKAAATVRHPISLTVEAATEHG